MSTVMILVTVDLDPDDDRTPEQVRAEVAEALRDSGSTVDLLENEA
jgi:hypothetical protein